MAIRRKTVTSSVIFICLAYLQTTAQTPVEHHEQIRSAVDAGDLRKALTELHDLREANPLLFAANNFDYLQARLSELTGDEKQATSAYESVLARKSLLSQYALWHLAQSARSIGDLVLERERLRQLMALGPTSLLRESANLRLGESFFESADYPNAIISLGQSSLSKNVVTARQSMLLIGQSYLGQHKEGEARDMFAKLIMQMPDASRPDDFALAAARALDTLDKAPAESQSTKANPLSEAEHLLRASIYQFNRDFSGARSHYQLLIEENPQSTSLPNALYQIGRGLYLEGKYEEATKYLQRVVDQFPNSVENRDALTLIAATLNRLKRTDEAVSAYRRLAERFPDMPNPERTFLNIIDALHEAGRFAEALDWVQRTRKQFKGQIGDALALFAQLRIHLAQEAWQAVVADADELLKMPDLGGTRVPGGTTKPELTFLRATALERLRKTEEAISVYLSIPEGRNDYYGSRATQRLQALGSDSAARGLIENRFNALWAEAKRASDAGEAERSRSAAQSALRLTRNPTYINELLELLRKDYSSLPAYKLPSFKLVALGRQGVLSSSSAAAQHEQSHQDIADELLFLGLYDEAVPEFIAARTLPAASTQSNKPIELSRQTSVPLSGSGDIDYTIAVYSLRAGLPNRAVRFAEQVWKDVPSDYLLEIAPPKLVELLYPVPYRESLLKHAPARDVDARFVLSVARQESRFQADAKSGAAARGLMQFIPATANEIALQLGREPSNHDELYNPDTAILFGSQYLANLFKQFPEQPQAVAASYNGGPDNAARWIARSRSNDADRYLPEIGFSQTKDYVYKVLSNYWIYEQLYDSRLQRKAAAR